MIEPSLAVGRWSLAKAQSACIAKYPWERAMRNVVTLRRKSKLPPTRVLLRDDNAFTAAAPQQKGGPSGRPRKQR